MAEYPNNSHSARERTDSTAPGKGGDRSGQDPEEE